MPEIAIWLVEFGTPSYDELLHLRDKELRKPLGINFLVEDISKEFEELHFGAFDWDDSLVGCLTLKVIDASILKMRQVVVDEAYRSKGIGQMMVRRCEEWAKQNNYLTIELNAREASIPFYEKLQYQQVGNSFEEVNILHWKMEKSLS